jgi:hypothetical protein
MDFQLTVHRGLSFLLVVALGRAPLCDVLASIDFVGSVTARGGDKRALLDLLAVDLDVTPAEHVIIGAHAARAWEHLERVASAVPEDYRVGMSESSAQAAGLNIRTFVTLDSAISWLTSS